MTRDRARERSKTQAQLGGGNIRGLYLERVFGLWPGADFSRAARQPCCWPRF